MEEVKGGNGRSREVERMRRRKWLGKQVWDVSLEAGWSQWDTGSAALKNMQTVSESVLVL